MKSFKKGKYLLIKQGEHLGDACAISEQEVIVLLMDGSNPFNTTFRALRDEYYLVHVDESKESLGLINANSPTSETGCEEMQGPQDSVLVMCKRFSVQLSEMDELLSNISKRIGITYSSPRLCGPIQSKSESPLISLIDSIERGISNCHRSVVEIDYRIGRDENEENEFKKLGCDK